MNCTEFMKIYLKKNEEKESIITKFVVSASQFLLKMQSKDDPKE